MEVKKIIFLIFCTCIMVITNELSEMGMLNENKS
jgi:hypothetical protein